MFDNSPQETIINHFKDFWVSNGDILSLQYTGTDSNISKVTKVDKRGAFGKVE